MQCNIDVETGEPGDDLTPEAIEYCQKLGSKATKVSEIISSKDKAIYGAIQKGISAVNEGAISNAQKVQKWVLLEKDFSLFGGELGEWWLGAFGVTPSPLPWLLNRQHCQDPLCTELPPALPRCGSSTPWLWGGWDEFPLLPGRAELSSACPWLCAVAGWLCRFRSQGKGGTFY